MIEPLSIVLTRNALKLLAREQRAGLRVRGLYRKFQQNAVTGAIMAGQPVTADLEDFLGNPFVRTALTILEKFTGNYRINQAIKLLREAGEEAKKEKKRRK